jgi:hypothetical protein
MEFLHLFVCVSCSDDYIRLWMHCSSTLYVEGYNGGWTGYGFCALTIGYQQLMLFGWIGMSYDPARLAFDLWIYNDITGLSTGSVSCDCPADIFARYPRLGYATSYTPSVQLAWVGYWDRALTTQEFLAVAQSYLPLPLQVGNFNFKLTDPPQSCPPSNSFSMTFYLPHTKGTAVSINAAVTSGGSASPSTLTW